MTLPLAPLLRIGSYTVRQHLKGGKYPLVLMLEPLLRCNLACPGCGKIDYPDAILNQRLSYDPVHGRDRRMRRARRVDCGRRAAAPPRHAQDRERLYRQEEVRHPVHQRCCLLKKKLADYAPSPYFTWSIHLDGDKAMHDHAVDQDGTYEVAIEAIELAQGQGLPRPGQLHRLRRRVVGAARRLLRRDDAARCRGDDLARLCL